MPRHLALLALALLIQWAQTAPAFADACPSYPYPSFDLRCPEHGFCGWVEPEAFADATEDRPGADRLLDTEPVSFEASAMAADSGASAEGSGIATADRGFVVSEVDADASSPQDGFVSAVARGRTISVFRVDDLVFGGPGASVETSLNLVFDADHEFFTSGNDLTERLGITAVLVGGALCNGSEYVSFQGQRQLSFVDNDGEPPVVSVAVNQGLLTDVPFDATSDLLVGPFTVPIGEPLHFELYLETTASGLGIGTMNTTHTYQLSIPLDGSPVFDLPSGYTVNSVEAEIVANAPEPGPALLAVVCALALAARGVAASRRCRR